MRASSPRERRSSVGDASRSQSLGVSDATQPASALRFANRVRALLTTSVRGTGNRGRDPGRGMYRARHSLRGSREIVLADGGIPLTDTPRLSRDRGSRLTGARRARPERASPTVRPLVSSPALPSPPPARLSLSLLCLLWVFARAAPRERDEEESVYASVDGEEGSRRAGHKVGGRYRGRVEGCAVRLSGGRKGEKARRVVSKETRTRREGRMDRRG